MALTSGTKLGPYEIQSPLGAGGMGEVYRARDTRLNRTVAVKVLPATFSNDLDRLHRFQYEARILSTLSHPNVLAIYDVGEQDGVRYLVSEFLEGQTLREKLAAGALSRWRITEYALETAKGLAAAHEKGVVHRDLKPDNIFITHDEHVKILDFGLAKQAPAVRGTDEGATVTSPPTTAGTVMGTVGYMSPEQVRGQTLDHRSDIFSFGTVLYEMASGKRAFHGESSVETMNAILKEDVQEFSATGTQVSPGLEKIIRRCLEKKPERRFQSASDLAFALEALSGTATSSSGAQAVSARVAGSAGLARKPRLAWLVAAGIAIALAASGAWMYTRPQSFNGRFTEITFRSAYIRAARFAGSGTVVFGAAINGEPMQVFLARTDTLETQPLKIKADVLNVSRTSEMALSLDRAFDVTWAPTGRLAKAPVGGGATRELLDNVTDADWNPEGTELAIARKVNDQFRLEYPPGKVLYENSGFVSELRFSPDGKRIAFLDHPIFGDDRGVVSVIDLQGYRQVLTEEFSSEQGLAWTPKGNEIWFTSTKVGEPSPLRAVDLKGRSRVVAAAPVRMHLQDIGTDGRVLLTSELMTFQVGLADAKSGRQTDLAISNWLSAISRDGSMILLNSSESGTSTNYRLFAQRTDGSPAVQIGEGLGTSFSPDTKWVSALDPTDPQKLSVIPTGVGETRVLHAPGGAHYMAAVLMPGDKQVLVSYQRAQGDTHTAVQDLETGSVHEIGPAGRYLNNFEAVLDMGPSPDGKQCLETDGKNHYWVQPLDGSAAREISGISPEESILEWHDDSNNVFVAKSTGPDVEVYNWNLTSGQRKTWARFSPADKTAMAGRSQIMMAQDGAHYAYQVQRIFSTLFVADGLH